MKNGIAIMTVETAIGVICASPNTLNIIMVALNNSCGSESVNLSYFNKCTLASVQIHEELEKIGYFED